MVTILIKNSDLQNLIKIFECGQSNVVNVPLKSEQLALFTYASIVSVDVECSFSRYKAYFNT